MNVAKPKRRGLNRWAFEGAREYGMRPAVGKMAGSETLAEREAGARAGLGDLGSGRGQGQRPLPKEERS